MGRGAAAGRLNLFRRIGPEVTLGGDSDLSVLDAHVISTPSA